jgi:putative redox protein
MRRKTPPATCQFVGRPLPGLGSLTSLKNEIVKHALTPDCHQSSSSCGYRSHMAKATATWSGHKVKFDIESASGHTVSVDDAPVFGDDEAMRPTEMLMAALGSCTGINVVLLMKKFKQPLKSLTVEVEGEQEMEWPRAFKKIEITFVLGWDGKYDKEKVDQAIDLACNRYCPIHATLTHGTKIEHRRKDR